MIDLSGKTLLITGASRGIGAAAAQTCAKAGGRVILHYGRDEAAMRRVADACGAQARGPVQADLAEPAAPGQLWADALAAADGQIDVLVNNAGQFLPAGVTAPDREWDDVWARTLQVNLKAAADLCRAAILHFQARGGGKIITVTSRAAHRGDDPDYMHYAASKAGLTALTKSIARGFGHEGILAFAIAPGFVETDMAADFIGSHGRAAASAGNALPDLAPPEQVGAAIAFFASDLCAHATGTTLDINSGSYVR